MVDGAEKCSRVWSLNDHATKGRRMLTITEALAEIATIDKRLPKKADEMLPYVARVEQVRDPFLDQGGSAVYITRERQSFNDLQKRKIALRAAIAKANAETTIVVNGKERTVADWLVWKRECYSATVRMLNGLLNHVRAIRREAQQKGVTLVNVDQKAQADDVVVNVDEQKLIEELDALEETFGKLDGLLSLKNATTLIEL